MTFCGLLSIIAYIKRLEVLITEDEETGLSAFKKMEEIVMKKRMLSLGLAVMMAASLTACGGSKTAETQAAAEGETAAAEAADE